jgi:O-antigen/teichoic acid export membrane protein
LNIISKKKFSEYYPEGKIDDSIKKNVKEQVAGLSISNVLGVSRDSLNSLLITSFFGLYIAGQYSNYCTIYDAVIGFFLVTTKAIQSSIGNSIVSESVEKNYINLTKMEFLHNIVTTACTVYMLCLYQPFMKIWMGEELMFSNPLMMLFVLYFYIRAMSEVRNAYFSALGYWWKAKWIFIIEAVVVIALMICLGKILGIAGIIIAPSISILAVNYIGITNILFKEYFGSGRKQFYVNRIVYTIITLIICTASWFVCRLIPYEGVPGLIVRLVLCTVVLLIMIPALMLIVKRPYVKEALVFIKQIFKA